MYVVDFGGSKKLMRRKTNLEVVKRSEIFDRIHDVHIALGHAGRDKLVAEIGKKFFNIPHKVINVYLATCTTCEKKTQPTAAGGDCCEVYFNRGYFNRGLQQQGSSGFNLLRV